MLENKRLRKLVIDKDTAEVIIRENYESIYKYCFYHLGNRDVAQDITQDVFFKFLKEKDKYREYGKLKNYLYVIAKNSVRDYVRRIKEVNLYTTSEKYDFGGIDKKLEQISIWEAVNSLEDTEKDIVILRYYQNMRIKDISQVMDIPASTARYKLKNAEKKLKKRLEI